MSDEQRGKRNLLRQELVPINDPSCELDAEGHCITCLDEALEARVLRVDQETGLALVTIKDLTEEIDITLVDGVTPGDLLLVHGGAAIANLEKHASDSAGASSFAQDA